VRVSWKAPGAVLLLNTVFVLIRSQEPLPSMTAVSDINDADQIWGEVWKHAWSVGAAIEYVQLVMCGNEGGCPSVAAAAIIKLIETFVSVEPTMAALHGPMMQLVAVIVWVRYKNPVPSPPSVGRPLPSTCRKF
jgi:hypothetical protein